MTTTVQARDQFVMANGLRFHYREWGSFDAPALLILHGVTGHSWEFDPIAGRLADAYRVIALDQRGHGASDWADSYAVDTMAGDLAAIIDAIGLGSVSVVGHSMGAIASYLCAARHPDLFERIALLDAGPDTMQTEFATAYIPVMLANMAEAVYATPDDAVAAYLAGNDGPTAELRRFVLNNLRTLDDSRCTWRFDAAGLHTSFSRDMATEERQWAALSAIACPTLVMRGAESPALTMTTATRMARELQRGELVVIPDAGHDVHIDQFDAVIRELWRFFIER